MNTEPDLKEWASRIIYISRNDFGTNILEQVQQELEEIADKYYQMGYADGDKTGWWKDYDSYISGATV